MAKAVSIAVPFVKNAGQFAAEVKFAADLFAGRFFLTGNELVYSLRQRGKTGHVQPGKRGRMAEARRHSVPGKGIVFKEYFIDKKGNRIDLKSNGERRAKTVVSYFKGKDAKNWYTGVASYQSVSLGEVYPGVEVKLKATGRNVEKVFYVSPRSSVAEIKIGMDGVSGLKVAGDGRLLLKNNLGELAMRKPIAWQEIDGERHDVKVDYRLLGNNNYGFAVSGDYNKNCTLIIDPDLSTLIASTFLGGVDDDYGMSLALDSANNIYITGATSSYDDFPTTIGAYDRELHGHSDLFISKLDNNLTRLLASTFLGGSEMDFVQSLDVDSAGNIYLAGATQSVDFPTTANSYDRTHNQRPGWISNDVFISKLDNSLTTLISSTFLGGKDSERGNSLALDSGGNVYITGFTDSQNFPVTPGTYGRTNNGSDVFISKLNNDLSNLLASTFMGGSGPDSGHSLALDKAGNVYVTGMTNSTDFPTTPGSYDRTHNGYYDVFIAKLNNRLTVLLASSYLGGSEMDNSASLSLDRNGNVYLTGSTGSTDFPVTAGAYDQTYNGGIYDVFVSKLNSNLATILASTFLGGRYWDDGISLVLDGSGSVYVAGHTGSSDFPTTGGAYDRKYNGDSCTGYCNGDIFVSKLNINLNTLLASTFLGGNYDESGISLVLDSSYNVYLTGNTESANFPTTAGAYNRKFNLGFDYDDINDVFIAKLNGRILRLALTAPNGSESWLVGDNHDIIWTATSSISPVNIDYSADNGGHWLRVASGTANDGRYAWAVPNTPSPTCLVRVSDVNDAQVSDTSDNPFSILIGIDLAAERREIKAFSILKQYGRIQFLVQTASDQAAQYRVLRRKASEDFVVLKTVAPSELRDNQFQMQDKYLEKATLTPIGSKPTMPPGKWSDARLKKRYKKRRNNETRNKKHFQVAVRPGAPVLGIGRGLPGGGDPSP